LFAALLGLAALPVEAVIPPPKTASYVHDCGNLLDAKTLAELSNIGEAIEKKTGAEVILVTVESLDGMPIEEYALSLFRSWGLGKREQNNGVLLLVDRERLLTGQSGKVRIEVGYGLEAPFPMEKQAIFLITMFFPNGRSRIMPPESGWATWPWRQRWPQNTGSASKRPWPPWRSTRHNLPMR